MAHRSAIGRAAGLALLFTLLLLASPWLKSAIAGVTSFPSTIAGLVAIYNQLVGGNNLDASANAPSLAGLNLLGTLAANSKRTGYIVQTQDTVEDCGVPGGPLANSLMVVLDDGNNPANTPTIVFLDYAAVKYSQGGALNMRALPHSGRIRYYGAAGCVVGAGQIPAP